MKNLVLILLLFSACFFSCEEETKESREANLPPSRGAHGDLIIVMDSAHWEGSLGEEVRKTFKAPIPGLPQDEPYFHINYVNPFKMNDVLRNVKNLVYVATMDNQSGAGRKLKSEFTKESIEKIASDPNVFMLSKQNVFAKNQEVLHLFGNNQEELIENIRKNRKLLRDHFGKLERERISNSIFAKEQKGITKSLVKDHQFSIKIPYGYNLVYNKENFVWIRQIDENVDKNIFISYRDYESEDVFSDENILSLRDIEVRKLGEDTDDVVYMKTETLVPLETEKVTFDNKYAVETRGLWKLSNNTMGGPFLSYIFVDETINRLYYIEGYVYSPGKDKRNPMKELEAILWSFRTTSK